LREAVIAAGCAAGSRKLVKQWCAQRAGEESVMDTTFSTYQFLTRDMDRTLKVKSEEPTVALATKYYEENIRNIKTIDDFFNDTRIYNYAVKAFGLEDMAYAKAYMRKVLTDDTFAKNLNDQRFSTFAAAFDFDSYGEATTQRPATTTETVDKYVQQSLEVDEGEQNEGVRLALYFKRMAPSITNTYQVLADTALAKVVKTVLGLPDAMGTAGIEQQAKAIDARIDIKDFQDPDKLNHLIQRFTVMYDLSEGTAYDPVLDLFSTGSSSTVGVDVSMTLLNLKIGG